MTSDHDKLSASTLCQSVQSISDICLKCIRSLDTSAFSALEVFDDYRTFFCGRPCDMELVTRQSERPGHQQRLLQTFTEDVLFSAYLDNALYKFTYLLT